MTHLAYVVLIVVLCNVTRKIRIECISVELLLGMSWLFHP